MYDAISSREMFSIEACSSVVGREGARVALRLKVDEFGVYPRIPVQIGPISQGRVYRYWILLPNIKPNQNFL